MLLIVLQPQVDQPSNGLRPARQVLLRAPPVVHVLPEAGRGHQLDALIELFVIAQEIPLLRLSQQVGSTSYTPRTSSQLTPPTPLIPTLLEATLVRVPREGGDPGAPSSNGWRSPNAPGAINAFGPRIPAFAGNAA